MILKGSSIVMECLKEEGTEIIFGYPGGGIMPLYDALYDYRDSVKHILTAHEQGAEVNERAPTLTHFRTTSLLPSPYLLRSTAIREKPRGTNSLSSSAARSSRTVTIA